MKKVKSKQSRPNLAAITLVALSLMALTEVALATRVADSKESTAGNELLLRNAPPPACIIRDNANKAATNNNDPLAKLLLAGGPCPANVFEFRARLLGAEAKIKTAFVGNRGFHNFSQGSFSMFEMVSGRLAAVPVEVAEGEFFFGHFTATTDGKDLIANQDPADGNLMIELIAWDPQKKLFNFYEVIGNGEKGQWFYRGDSLDIQADIKLLHRQTNANNPRFGTALRCSGCHTAGGPIMKELATPHNDWETARHLPLGNMQPDDKLALILSGLVDAQELAKSVTAGLLKLAGSENFQKAKSAFSLQEQLRPLFCPVELNLESDLTPLDDKGPQVRVPSAFLIDPRLAQDSVTIEGGHYDAALVSLNSSFPEGPKRRDADHGWLTPVKAFSDALAIDSLIKQGLIDQEFVSDVLAVDLTNPALSSSRCGLLRLLPNKADAGWKETFKASLKTSGKTNVAAQELFNNLTDATRNTQFHQARGKRLLSQCRNRLQTKDAVIKLSQLLSQRRAEAFASEISRNPMGQILEPGFRVVFPKTRPPIKPGTLRLTDDCLVVNQ
jgi:hypothetical protein